MAHFLCDYDYEPEYTAEEVEVPFFVFRFWFLRLHRCLFTIELQLSCLHFVLYAATPSWSSGDNFYRHTSSLFQLNCPFMQNMILLNINLHFKPYIFQG